MLTQRKAGAKGKEKTWMCESALELHMTGGVADKKYQLRITWRKM